MSETFAAVQDQRDRTVVDERYLHHRLELPGRDGQAGRFQIADDAVVERPRDFPQRGGGERRASPFPAVREERELRHNEHGPADVLHRTVEAARRLSPILEDTHVADLGGDVTHVVWAVTLFDSEEDQKADANLSNRSVADRDSRLRDALYDRPHWGRSGVGPASDASWAASGTNFARSSAGGFNRVSSRCLGATLPSAFNIDCLTPGCSRSSSINSRLVR